MPGSSVFAASSAHGPFFIASSVANGSVQSLITACAVFTRARAPPSSAARSPAVGIYSSIFGSLSRVNEPAPPPPPAAAPPGWTPAIAASSALFARRSGLAQRRPARARPRARRLGLLAVGGAASPPARRRGLAAAAGGAAPAARGRWRAAAGGRIAGRRIVAGGAQDLARDRRARGAGRRELLGHLALGLRALADLLRDARLQQLSDERLDGDLERLLRPHRPGEVEPRLGQRPLADLELAELVSEDPQHLVLEVALRPRRSASP